MTTPLKYISVCSGIEAADGPRYKALGNSMAVPVMRWIGERIEQVDQITAVIDTQNTPKL